MVLTRPFKGIYLFYVVSLRPYDMQLVPFDPISERLFDVATVGDAEAGP